MPCVAFAGAQRATQRLRSRRILENCSFGVACIDCVSVGRLACFLGLPVWLFLCLRVRPVEFSADLLYG